MERNTKIKVGILGATGLIGQVFVKLLSDHPVFEPVVLTGSGKGGEQYSERVKWKIPFNIPENASKQIVSGYDINILKSEGIKFIFSALPSEIAEDIENELREHGFYLFSNASSHRYDHYVPIVIPDVNPEALDMIKKQGFPKNGFIVTNPNCSTAGLAIALNPLKKFGIREVTVSTYQAVSGAGYPGLSAMDITNTVIPHIEGEEEKIEIETKKILEIDPDIFASCVRVPTLFGHLESVWVTFNSSPGPEDVEEAWETGTGPYELHSLPRKQVICLTGKKYPGNDLAFKGDPPGMQVYTGGLRQRNGKTGFNLMANNLVRGGAGGSVANAELFIKKFGRIK